jgi:ABC-type spermidine/putrescine transport system permease subunit II
MSAIVTTVITIALMLPTTVYVHLRLPGIRRLMEGITILPIVIPPVVLIVGVLAIAPGSLKSSAYLLSLEYVVLAMPFAYRAIDAGLRSLDLKTIVEASNSLGARWITTLMRVILPNLRTALLSATVLTVALVLGEYTMASLALYQTFPVWIYVNSQTSGQVSVAASLLALFVTWFFLMIITVLGTRQSRRTDLAHPEAEAHVVQRAHVREQAVALEHHAHVPLGGRHRGDVLAVDQDRSGIRDLKAGHDAQGRGLAAAGRTEQCDQLARGHVDGQPVQGLGGPEEAAQILQHDARAPGLGHLPGAVGRGGVPGGVGGH